MRHHYHHHHNYYVMSFKARPCYGLPMLDRIHPSSSSRASAVFPFGPVRIIPKSHMAIRRSSMSCSYWKNMPKLFEMNISRFLRRFHPIITIPVVANNNMYRFIRGRHPGNGIPICQKVMSKDSLSNHFPILPEFSNNCDRMEFYLKEHPLDLPFFRPWAPDRPLLPIRHP